MHHLRHEPQGAHAPLSDSFPHQTPIDYFYTQILAHLIQCSQRLYGLDEESAYAIATEIASVSHQNLLLLPHRQQRNEKLLIPYVPEHRPFLVQWQNIVYGSLHCKVIEEVQEMILPPALCERLAHDCAWCLHILEKEAQQQRQRLFDTTEAHHKMLALSNAQHTVLQFMVKGFSTQAIAETLHVSKRTVETHQRGIYQELDVHSQREAILIGLAAGLSPA